MAIIRKPWALAFFMYMVSVSTPIPLGPLHESIHYLVCAAYGGHPVIVDWFGQTDCPEMSEWNKTQPIQVHVVRFFGGGTVAIIFIPLGAILRTQSPKRQWLLTVFLAVGVAHLITALEETFIPEFYHRIGMNTPVIEGIGLRDINHLLFTAPITTLIVFVCFRKRQHWIWEKRRKSKNGNSDTNL